MDAEVRGSRGRSCTRTRHLYLVLGRVALKIFDLFFTRLRSDGSCVEWSAMSKSKSVFYLLLQLAFCTELRASGAGLPH